MNHSIPSRAMRAAFALLAALTLTGSEDFAVEQVERLAEARPDAQTTIIPNNDHNSTLSAPEFRESLAVFSQASNASTTP